MVNFESFECGESCNKPVVVVVVIIVVIVVVVIVVIVVVDVVIIAVVGVVVDTIYIKPFADVTKGLISKSGVVISSLFI